MPIKILVAIDLRNAHKITTGDDEKSSEWNFAVIGEKEQLSE